MTLEDLRQIGILLSSFGIAFCLLKILRHFGIVEK